jgi:DNA invertase Pin-like site-specific DNA recombinase
MKNKHSEKNIVRVGIYARVSTADQQTLSMQIKELKEYAKLRKWHSVDVEAFFRQH